LPFGIRETGYYPSANTKDICFLIGPEGDFSLKEIQMLKKNKSRL
jgi:16S rRNA U1498 N3-methylase RsmE